MKFSMVARLQVLQQRYEEIRFLFNDPDIISNQARFCALSQEFSQLSDIVNYFQQWCQVKEDIQIVSNLLHDTEMHDIAQEELKSLYNIQDELSKQIKLLLLPKDVDDQCGCFLEIRAGTGGNEAALFASNLFHMYNRFAEIHQWDVEIISVNNSEYGGFKEIIIKISNKGAYGLLKFESGGHRVQRIPETESQGRIHTSTCTVAVIPEIPEVDLPKINVSDLRIYTFRASGAGGQHVNTTDSAIRITHLPTGLTVECQDERSQHKNKAKALTVLAARLRAAEIKQRNQNESNMRQKLLGSGDRSDRIRTYNFPQRRITDHRIGLSIYRLEEILEGKLNLIIQPIIQKYHIDQLTTLSKMV